MGLHCALQARIPFLKARDVRPRLWGRGQRRWSHPTGAEDCYRHRVVTGADLRAPTAGNPRWAGW